MRQASFVNQRLTFALRESLLNIWMIWFWHSFQWQKVMDNECFKNPWVWVFEMKKKLGWQKAFENKVEHDDRPCVVALKSLDALALTPSTNLKPIQAVFQLRHYSQRNIGPNILWLRVVGIALMYCSHYMSQPAQVWIKAPHISSEKNVPDVAVLNDCKD